MKPIGSAFSVISGSGPGTPTTLVTTESLDGETVEATVYEDTSGDGSADNIESVTLDGSGSYGLSSFVGGGSYWITVDGGDSDVTNSFSLDALEVGNNSWDEPDTFRDLGGISLDSTGDHTASIEHGYSYEAPSSTLYDGLVGYWPLHDWSGQATDLSGSGNHGTVNGATQGVAGKGGLTAYSFDGSNDNITTGLQSLSTPCSFSAWIRPKTRNNDQIISNYAVGSNDVGLQLHNTGHDGVYRFFCDPADTVDGNLVDLNEWSHVVGVVDSSGTYLYTNGNLANTGAGTADGTSLDSGDVYTIGQHSPSNGSGNFSGSISDVRIYDRALSAEEVSTIYEWGTADVANPPTDGVAYYPLDGDAIDSWGGNDGTNNGATFVADSIRGQSGRFISGENDYIDCGDIGDTATNYTVSAWVKITDGSTNTYPIEYANSIDTGNFPTYMFRFECNQVSSGSIEFGVEDGNQNTAEVLLTESGLNSWIHVTGTRVGTDVYGYVNGTLVGHETLPNNTNPYDGSGVFLLGRRGHGNYYDGNIDDVRVYDYALEPHEVFDLYRWGTFGRDMRHNTVNQ